MNGPESQRDDNCCCQPCGFPNNQFPIPPPKRRRRRECADPAQFVDVRGQCAEIPFFGNTQQFATAGCSSGAGEDVTVGVGPNTVFSRQSQEDADVAAYEYALESAEAQVECVGQFFSAAQTANAICPNGMVKQSTVPTGAYVSTVSQADANLQAYNIAFAKAQSMCSGSLLAPEFIVEPRSVTIPYGTSTTLVAQVSAAPAPTYQWYQGNAGDTSRPVGGNSNVFTTPVLYLSTPYWAYVSNSQGAASSTTAVVTVTQPAQILLEYLTLTALTGGNESTLDGQPTAGLQGQAYMVIIPNLPLQFWQIVPGSGPTNPFAVPAIVTGSDTATTGLVFQALN